MKQVIQDYRSGKLSLQDIPPPQLRAGGVLVRNAFSLISAGTERGMIDLARKSLLGKARARPDLVRKVLDKARTDGPLTAYQKAKQRLETPMPLGYSSAGIVEAVGAGVTDLEAGDAVACGGVGYACHAEVVFVPRNLCVKVPPRRLPDSGTQLGGNGSAAAEPALAIGLDGAAYATLGSIALEGVRVADVRLGETAVVIGLGLVGLLTVQLLKAAGCRIVGMDPDAERCRLAEELGCDRAVSSGQEAENAVRQLSDGFGADAVLIAAATSSSEPVRLAGALARDRARVVIIGIVGMEIPHKLYYEKALAVSMARSYGPGRYDRLYEEKGLDYPIAYVRWTENRNMRAFLELVAEGKVSVSRLTTHRFPIESAVQAYELITAGKEPHIGVLLEHGLNRPEANGPGGSEAVAPGRPSEAPVSASPRVVVNERPPAASCVGVGLIGAGNFATGVLLPGLKKLKGVELRGVCSQGGLNARAVAGRFGFSYCTSDPHDILGDRDISAVLIATNPSSHAALAVAARAAGKHVFVEKPLAVNLPQLRQITAACSRNGRGTNGDHEGSVPHASSPGLLVVGFNRRYSPFARQLKEFFGPHHGPMVAVYRVNANHLPRGDWQHDPEEGGGRIIGEAGHFVDLLAYLTGARPESVLARAVAESGNGRFPHENASLVIRFADGSIGTIVYTTEGAPGFSKERLEVFCDGATGVLDDFRSLELVRGSRRRTHRSRLSQDKGHRAELSAFIEAVRDGGAAPVPFEDYALTTLCTFQAVESLRTGEPQPVNPILLNHTGDADQ
jgi:predicted dehydrogenase